MAPLLSVQSRQYAADRRIVDAITGWARVDNPE